MKNKNIINQILCSLGCFIFLFVPLLIFVIPTDILDKCQICLNFTNFMKKYFVSIDIFENVSQIPQVTSFYVSIMWLWSFINMIFLSWMIILARNTNIKTNTLLAFMGLILLISFSYGYFDGSIPREIMEKGWLSGAKTLNVNMGSRVDMLFYIFIMHCGVSLPLPMVISILIDKFKRNKQ